MAVPSARPRGADDDRLLCKAGLAAGGHLSRVSDRPDHVRGHRGRNCSSSKATPRCASASGTWAISRSSCRRSMASIITSGLPYSNDMGAAKNGRKGDHPQNRRCRWSSDLEVIEAAGRAGPTHRALHRGGCRFHHAPTRTGRSSSICRTRPSTCRSIRARQFPRQVGQRHAMATGSRKSTGASAACSTRSAS